MSTPLNNTNRHFLDKSFEKIANDIISNHIGADSLLIGLGSGRSVSKVVNGFSDSVARNCEFICTSLQIKIDAERKGLKTLDEAKIPLLDLVVDGADQIDRDYFMIKGGGGALLREKILYHSSKKTIIIGDFTKFVSVFSRPLPIEVIPFGRTAVTRFLVEMGAKPALRTLEKGYPYLTENGNIILDTMFTDFGNVLDLEKEIRKIPGVLETGFFVKPASIYYKALENGGFQVIGKKTAEDIYSVSHVN